MEHALSPIVSPLNLSHCPPRLWALFLLYSRYLFDPTCLGPYQQANLLSMPSMESPTMETENHHGTDGEFAHSPWVELGAFNSPQHSPPMPEYSGFDYDPSSLMAVDTSYGMSIPPPYASMPLPIPSHSWPSMLTTQSPFHESGIPPAHTQNSASTSSSSARPPAIRKTSTGGSTPRRTLTDEDRRQMCLYHEENKTAKQTDIGGMMTGPCEFKHLMSLC